MSHQQQTAFENIVGKGEIAHKEQFLLFPQCFLLIQISVSPFVYIFGIISLFAAESEETEIGISGQWLTLHQTPKSNTRQQTKCSWNYMLFDSEMVENTLGKRKIAGYQLLPKVC